MVSTRSTTYSTRYSSSTIPNSLLVRWFRLKPVAMSWSSVGLGSKSPAICSTVKSLNGLFELNASITQSRQRHISTGASF